jgi:glyoxylate reductase
MNSNIVVLTRRIPPAGLDILAASDATIRIVESEDDAAVDPTRIVEAARGADVLIALLTERISADLLSACPRLRGIANMAVGYNNIDVPAATAIGIPVSNTPGVLTDTTADLTWAILLAAARRIVEADAYMRAGRYRMWGAELMLGADVSPGGSGRRKTLGIIGYGRIGRAVARRALGFDMDVIAYSPGHTGIGEHGAAYTGLDELLQRSDYISIHAPARPETIHMIGEREIGLMKPTAYVINVARGEIIDEAALVEALQQRRIAGAALDVFEREPEMAEGLAQCSNAVLVPHIGSASADTRNLMSTIAATNAVAFLRGERAPDTVNPEVYAMDSYASRAKAAP